MGGRDKGNTPWRRILQSKIRKIAAAEKNLNRKARAGKNSFPLTPFLFARPSDWILKFGIRIFVKKVRTSIKKHRQVLHSAKLKNIAEALCAEATSYDFTKS